MAGGCSGDVLLWPLTHNLAFGHLHSPVDDDIEVDTQLDVSVDSFAITKTITAHITTTNIVLTGCLVLFVRYKPVASSKYGLISKDAAHSFSVVGSDFMDRTRSLWVVYSIGTILPFLPRVTECVGG